MIRRLGAFALAAFIGGAAASILQAQPPWADPSWQILTVGMANPTQDCLAGQIYSRTNGTLYVCSATNTWSAVGYASSGGVPTGGVIFVASGSCPSGYSEVSGLDGKMVRGTLNANGNVGTTGGSDSVTPTFTGNSVTSSAVSAGTPAGSNSAPALTMNSYTPAGTNNAPAFTGTGWTPPAIAWPAGVPTNAAVTAGTPAGTNAASATSGNCAATNIAAGTGSTTACKATAPNLTVTAQTFTGSALGTHTHTISWPAGVPTIAAYTPAGSVAAPTFSGSAATLTGSVAAPTFTGSALGTHTHTTTATGSISAVDTRAAFIYLIGCQKT